jgi:hypothetical protein
MFTGQGDILSDMELRRCSFIHKTVSSENRVVRALYEWLCIGLALFCLLFAFVVCLCLILFFLCYRVSGEKNINNCSEKQYRFGSSK